MYESITYAELKSLSREEKYDAWKELKTMYSTQKELAEKLGVSPAVVYNMISRYAKDAPGRRKRTDKPEIKKTKRTGRKAKEEVLEQKMEIIPRSVETVIPETNAEETTNEAFSIAVKKAVSGEDAQFLLNGIGSTLLKNQKYRIEVRIIEE